MSKTIFLSTVTGEFLDLRRRLAGLVMRTQRVHVRHQDEFVQRGVLTLRMLEEEIRQSDLVVHVIGAKAGWIPSVEQVDEFLGRHPDFAVRFADVVEAARKGEVSATQWEAWLALYFAAQGQAIRLCPYESIDSRAGREPQQAAHVARLEQRGVHPKEAASEHDVIVEVLLTLIELGYLTKAESQRIVSLPLASLGELFKGRDEFLETVRNRLRTGHVSAIVGAQAVHGLGGLGKTRAAVEYALRHVDEYSAVLFVSADQPESLEKNLAELSGPLVLNLPEQDVKEQAVRYAAVVGWLQKNSGWFLILDNVDDAETARVVEQLLPQLREGHVLITSRFGEWSGGVDRLDLQVLTPEASIEFLEQRTAGRRRIAADDKSAVAALAGELDGLPLALEQAAAFLVAKGESFAGYLSRWQAHERKVRTWHDADRMHYPRSIAITWDTSFEQLEPASRALLNMLSWYAPDPIPVEVWQTEKAAQAIADGARRLSPDSEPDDAEDARAGLARYGLIQWEPNRAAFSVHRLVQEVSRERLTDDDSRAALQSALDVLNAYLPGDPPPQDVRSWPRWTPIRQHATTLIAHADQNGLTQPTTHLMNELGLLLMTKGLWAEAESLYRRALGLAEQSYGDQHPNVASDLANLAVLLWSTNRLAEAERLMRRALAIDEQSYGDQHPNVASDLNNLAQLLQDTNRLAEAEPLMRRALAIDEQSYGDQHPRVATDLNNLATLLQSTNHLAEAEPLMRRALAIDEQSYGDQHPDVARDLNNLAQLLQATKRLAEAEPLMARVVAIFESAYGESHPNVATSLNNLAQLLKATNRLAEAEPLMRRALAIGEESLGPYHAWVANPLHNLAQFLQATNRPEEAEPLMRRALAILQQSLGDQHPNTITVRKNYDRLLAEMPPSET